MPTKKEELNNIDNIEEEESLKDLYENLPLGQLVLITMDTRVPDFRKNQSKSPPYSGTAVTLSGLNKQMTYLDLLEQISLFLKWPVDEIRLWEQDLYEEFMGKSYELYDIDEDRLTKAPPPTFIYMEEKQIIFPFFLNEQGVACERVHAIKTKVPLYSSPEVLSQNEWRLMLLNEWNGKHPKLNNSIYNDVEIIRMERNKRNNTLFNSLGFLFHILGNVQGEEEVDDMKEGLAQASKYRAPKMRLELARYAVDEKDLFDSSTLFSSEQFEKVEDYAKCVLDPYYKGGNLDLTLAALHFGARIEVFDVKSKRLHMYGKGYVEKYGNPERLGPRFSVKLVKWANETFDPLCFSMEAGMEPDRTESPFCITYTKKAFEWLSKQKTDQNSDIKQCTNCEKAETAKERHSTCADCRMVFYCSKKCQLMHWRDRHRGMCQKRDFSKESEQSTAEEKNLLRNFLPEMKLRLERRLGIRRVRAVTEKFRDLNDKVSETQD